MVLKLDLVKIVLLLFLAFSVSGSAYLFFSASLIDPFILDISNYEWSVDRLFSNTVSVSIKGEVETTDRSKIIKKSGKNVVAVSDTKEEVEYKQFGASQDDTCGKVYLTREFTVGSKLSSYVYDDKIFEVICDVSEIESDKGDVEGIQESAGCGTGDAFSE